MKIFHIADLHLGKLVQGIYMTDDQRYIMEQFIEAIDTEKPDVVIIAGDLYDRAIPPVEAVDLLDDVLAEIVLKRNIPVLAIAGNHDSPTRLQFANKLLKENGLHIVGVMSKQVETVVLKDHAGEVHFHLIPFAEPSIVRSTLQDDSIATYDDAMRKTIELIDLKQGARHVAIAHAFVTNNGNQEKNTSDSERPLAIGGSECVDAAYFEPFHYTALGHLHRAHKVKHDKIRYAGSPLKYSSSEAGHEKGFIVIDLQPDGTTVIENRKLTPLRDLRIVEGKLHELLAGEISEDYVFVHLLDEAPVVGAMEQLRTVFPNAMHVERKISRVAQNSYELDDEKPTRDKLDDVTLFKAFYTDMTGEEVNDTTIKLFEEALQGLLDEEREVLEVATK